MLRSLFLCFIVTVAFVAEAQVAYGGDPCSRGPHSWCASYENAQQCEMVDYCNTNGWYTSEPVGLPQAVGGNPCTWGPSFWCGSYENAQQCDSFDYCNRVGWQTN